MLHLIGNKYYLVFITVGSNFHYFTLVRIALAHFNKVCLDTSLLSIRLNISQTSDIFYYLSSDALVHTVIFSLILINLPESKAFKTL